MYLRAAGNRVTRPRDGKARSGTYNLVTCNREWLERLHEVTSTTGGGGTRFSWPIRLDSGLWMVDGEELRSCLVLSRLGVLRDGFGSMYGCWEMDR